MNVGLLEVTTRFNQELRTLFATKPEVHRFLDTHERKELCLKNLCREIVIAEARSGARFQKKQLDSMVSAVAKIFAQAALTVKEQELLSTAQKLSLKKAPQSIEETKEELADMGVIIDEVGEAGTARAHSIAQRPRAK